MAGIKFLSENLFDTADVSLSSGSENAQFPLINLKNDSPSIKFRSTGSSAVLLIDLLQTRDIDCVALAFDTLTVMGVSDASFKTSLTTDFTASPTYVIDLSSEENIGFLSIDVVTHRFIELTLTSSIYVEISNIFIGQSLELPLNSISIGSFSYGRIDRSNVEENRYGQKFIDIINKTKTLGGTIQYCTKEEQDELDDLWSRHGKTKPLWIILDESSQAMTNGQFKLTMYGYLNKDFEWSASGGQLYNVSLEMSQAI